MNILPNFRKRIWFHRRTPLQFSTPCQTYPVSWEMATPCLEKPCGSQIPCLRKVWRPSDTSTKPTYWMNRPSWTMGTTWPWTLTSTRSVFVLLYHKQQRRTILELWITILSKFRAAPKVILPQCGKTLKQQCYSVCWVWLVVLFLHFCAVHWVCMWKVRPYLS